MAGKRRALIVANGEYDNAGLQRLMSPAADADALADVLANRTISDFDVQVVRNETAHVVQAEIEDLFAEGKPDDVLLLHFSCHGLKNDTGELFFAARNTRPDRLGSTAVPAEFVQRCMRLSRSRSIVLLLDCCYGGAFGEGVAVRASGDANVLDNFRGGGRGRAVITASNSIEYAFEDGQLAEDRVARPSVFTAALVEGLRTGEADRDEDGWIALGELYDYLFDRVRERNPKQTPSRDIEMQGELYLARSHRRKIKPSPNPADLEAAIASESMFARLGAVAELRRRLGSDNLAVAVGAFEALKTMAATDIRNVAEVAEEALRDVEIRFERDTLTFTGAPGGVGTTRIQPLGPPLARALRYEPSHAWIRMAGTDEAPEVTVTAGASGVWQGKIVATGPTGEAVLTVEMKVDPPVVLKPPPPPAPPPSPPRSPQPAVSRPPEPVVAVPEPPVARRVPAAAWWAAGLGFLGVLSMFSVPQLRVTALLSIAGAVCMLVPKTRRHVGPGLLAGAAFVALWTLAILLDFALRLSSTSPVKASLWVDSLGSVVVVTAAALCALRVARRELPGGLRLLKPPGWPSWLVVGLGAVGAVAAVVQSALVPTRSPDLPLSAFFAEAVVMVVVPLVAASVSSRTFALSMLLGWAGLNGYLFIPLFVALEEASPVPLIVTACCLGLLSIVFVADRNQPIGRQS